MELWPRQCQSQPCSWTYNGSVTRDEGSRSYQDQPGRVTIPGHPNDDLRPGTEKSVLTQAGLRVKP
ncbi:MAG: type II toxin-antitoxin system HicA family toxin [Bryobacteraceae bacterium]